MSGLTVKGIDELIGVLARVKARLPDLGKKVVGQGCNNIKKDWKARWTGYAHIPHLPRSISYDVDEAATTLITGEVGPKGPDYMQVPLASYIELGTVNNGPIPGMVPALAAEEPRFISAAGDLAEKALGDG